MEKEGQLKFALEHVTHHSVFIVERTDWEQMIDKSGVPVKLASMPSPISGLVSMAAHVMAAGSGIYNPSPGIDIVRYDPGDAPYIYNIDHYTVIESFVSTPLYQDALRVARVEETEELNEFIESHVFVVGPYRAGNHWVEEIPQQIREARSKD